MEDCRNHPTGCLLKYGYEPPVTQRHSPARTIVPLPEREAARDLLLPARPGG